MTQRQTKDSAHKIVLDYYETQGAARLGMMNNYVWYSDPRRLVFTLARYKFVAKMISGSENVVEFGCGDAFGSRIVKQEVGRLTVTDFDPLFIEDVRARMDAAWPFDAVVHDILSGPFPGGFDAAYSLDVMEHIPVEQEDRYLENIKASLLPHGIAVIGMPSLESQPYASIGSRAGHINCKNGADFKRIIKRHFHNVFVFSMNDEVVHTGFFPMAHYLFAVGCGVKSA